jgi:hypothetical protein
MLVVPHELAVDAVLIKVDTMKATGIIAMLKRKKSRK